MKLKRALSIFLIITLVIAISVIAKDTEKTDDTITCPVTGKVLNKSEAQGPVMLDGKEYYFACKKSMEKFQKNPDEYLSCTHKHSDPNKKTEFKATYNGTDYYFCSEKCKTAFDKDPSAYLAQLKKADAGKVHHEKADCATKCPHSKNCATKCGKK